MDLYAIIEGKGLSLLIVGMTIVFIALVLLVLLIKGFRNLVNGLHSRRLALEQLAGKIWAKPVEKEQEEVPANVIAAIALTLFLDDEITHDKESQVLTLHSLPKPYSNWWMRDLIKYWSTRKGKPTLKR